MKLYQNIIQTMTRFKELIHRISQTKTLYSFAHSSQTFVIQAAIVNYITLLAPPNLLFAQDYTTTIKKTAHFQNAISLQNELYIYNVNGPVTVEGYDGDEIQVTVKERINGTHEEVQRAKEELQFKVEQSSDDVLVYLDAPFIKLKRHNGHISYHIDRDDENDSYHFFFGIHIRMPKRTAIHASTINDGNVSISNTTGKVFASNINGSLQLDHISGKTDAHTINGNITIKYDKSPNKDSEYHTINGKIEAFYPRDLSADIRFKSMQGNLYTNFSNVQHLKASVQTNKDHDNGKTIYHVDRLTPIRIGHGGPTFNFQVLNGNVYIKQIQS